MSKTISLKDFLFYLSNISSDLDLENILKKVDVSIFIENISLNTNMLSSNSVFIACGKANQYISVAAQKGAKVILSDSMEDYYSSVPIIKVNNLSNLLQLLADFFYPRASKLEVIGVTGTNGKTSTCHLIYQLLSLYGLKAGYIGTIGYGCYKFWRQSCYTTPDIFSLYAALEEFAEMEIEYVAMEISSHALVQNRVDGVNIKTAVFTNLTRDHIDYHGSMDNYLAAKIMLFNLSSVKNIVLNTDCEYSKKVFQEINNKQEKEFSFFSCGRVSQDNKDLSTKTLSVELIKEQLQGITARVNSSFGSSDFKLNLIGKFNLSNFAAVLAVADFLDLEFKKVLSLSSSLQPVVGRMQTIKSEGQALAVVDFSHTPDSLEKALKALMELKNEDNKIICVFGCGGDRDKGKRPIMGEVASRLADIAVITDDNPRTENKELIYKDILKGIENKEELIDSKRLFVVNDRRLAIEKAFEIANPQDIVLIAGKGHEDYQIIGKKKYKMLDQDIVNNFFSKSFVREL